MERKSRKRDLNTTAFRIVQVATGEAPKRRPPESERAQEKPKKPTRDATQP